MSRVLAYTSPAHGHLFPLMAILEELRRRGHEVALRTLAGEVAKLRSLGFEAKPIASGIEALRMDDWKARTPIGGAKEAMAVFGARAEHDAADLRQAIEEERPDAVLVDIMSWGALAAAEAWGGPWASFSPLPLPLPSPDAPPFGPGLRPARGPPRAPARPAYLGVLHRCLRSLCPFPAQPAAGIARDPSARPHP